MMKLMIQLLFLALCLLLTSCYFGANESYRKITGGFYLMGWDDKDWRIVFSEEDQPDYFKIVIDHSVFSDGHNDNFIIAKQHPHKDKEVQGRLFYDKNFRGHYQLKYPKDTVYLIRSDSIYTEGGNWYHTKKEWTDPDSLRPCKSMTIYWIIDIRPYHEHYKVYSFDTEKEYNKKRIILGIPKDLDFEFTDNTMK